MTTFRKATQKDIPIVARLAMLAQASGSDTLPFQALFKLSAIETLELYKALAAEEDESMPFSYRTFFLMEEGTEVIGGCAAWIEPQGFTSSDSATMLALQRHLGRERIQEALPVLKAMKKTLIKRTPNTLQLENIAIAPKHQGKGFVRQLIKRVLQYFQEKQTSEILLMKENTPALKAYYKLGFQVKACQALPEQLAYKVLPGETHCKMVKEVKI